MESVDLTGKYRDIAQKMVDGDNTSYKALSEALQEDGNVGRNYWNDVLFKEKYAQKMSIHDLNVMDRIGEYVDNKAASDILSTLEKGESVTVLVKKYF